MTGRPRHGTDSETELMTDTTKRRSAPSLSHWLRCSLGLAVLCLACPIARADERDDLFETKIRPVLLDRCFSCHGDNKTSGGLKVDSRESLLKGGDTGPAMTPGKPADSLLMRAIRRQADVSAMPPEKSKALRADETAAFEKWIAAGAVWPATSKKFASQKHWAFEPVRDVAAPGVRDKQWSKTSIDPFILARQEARGIRPAAPADKRTLIRRATFDLTGLPPTPAEIDAFLKDDSPGAFETVVDRLLKSPAYGERWGRHWLDVVRYADTAGDTADYPTPLAWKYRNYVIDAFNADKPYDEFLLEQIAGDILAAKGPREKYAERVTATGFLAISRRFGFDSENYHHLTIQDTIDTLGQATMGLSLGCARCHDHKFDAVSMKDYYGLFAIFESSRYAFPGSEQKQRMTTLSPLSPPVESRPKWSEFESRVAALSDRLARQKIGAPATPLKSLHEIDGDFETQAPAAGGSNGVLVLPWLYEGKIAVTEGAQSPFKNLHTGGRKGASIAANAGAYRIWQAPTFMRTGDLLQANLDFRISQADASTTGSHHFSLSSLAGASATEVLISATAVSLRTGDRIEKLASLKPGEWQNLQLTVDLKRRVVSGKVGAPGSVTAFADKPLIAGFTGAVEVVTLKSHDAGQHKLPAIDYDNVGWQDSPIAPVTTTLPTPATPAGEPDAVALAAELQQLTGFDGDLELQRRDTAPVAPWNPGPNSVVKISEGSQSPFRNVYPAGRLGIHLPNRGAYDGFGLSLAQATPDKQGKLHIAFDFRVGDKAAGGDGSWRYYIGQGAGNSAAVELYFNAKEFFRRSGDAKTAVTPITPGEWHQVRLVLDMKARRYSGIIESAKASHEFAGECATGWTGVIDYSFIDSYGHLPGVRPAFDTDNFVVRDRAIPAINTPLPKQDQPGEARTARIAELRKQIDSLRSRSEADGRELSRLVANGPVEFAYAMAEGTPHDVRMQLRGEPDRPGDVVKRGTIKSLAGGPLPEGTPGSGRWELAGWLTNPGHPLTARVMANRVWQYHFGRGLVKTPNDFGVRGMAPTHPELLDHLATRFVQSGWSVKALHRMIMLSATYRQAVVEQDGKAPADALDTYAGFPRRRLDAEEIRDAILMVSGELDATPGREHPFPSPVSWGFSQHAPFIAVYEHDKRSVYLMTQRLKRHPFLGLFDGPDPNATTADRLTTTVPTQALFFLNDPFVYAKSLKWAARLRTAGTDDAVRLDLAWRQAIGRSPTANEQREGLEFLAAYRAELKAIGADDIETKTWAACLRTMLGGNEFLHVD